MELSVVVELDPEGTAEAPAAGVTVFAAVTGQTVVYSEITSVVTWPSFAGQFVTVAAQEVTV